MFIPVTPTQRRSQVSLVGGADRIPGGNKPQYLYIPVPIKCQGGQPRGGGSNFSRGG